MAMAEPGHAWVIGGSSGIGAAVAHALALAGWRLSLSARGEQGLRQACQRLGGLAGARVSAWPVDAMDAQGLSQTAARLAQAHGPVDLLVYAAGDAVSGRFDAMPLAVLSETLQAHVIGAMVAVQAVWPSMKARAHGQVVLVGSTASLQGFAYVAPYVAAKHAQLGLVKAWQQEWAGTGVRAVCVCPSYTDTPLLDRAVRRLAQQSGVSEDVARQKLWAQMPGGRPLDPSEVAEAVMAWSQSGGDEPALTLWPTEATSFPRPSAERRDPSLPGLPPATGLPS